MLRVVQTVWFLRTIVHDLCFRLKCFWQTTGFLMEYTSPLIILYLIIAKVSTELIFVDKVALVSWPVLGKVRDVYFVIHGRHYSSQLCSYGCDSSACWLSSNSSYSLDVARFPIVSCLLLNEVLNTFFIFVEVHAEKVFMNILIHADLAKRSTSCLYCSFSGSNTSRTAHKTFPYLKHLSIFFEMKSHHSLWCESLNNAVDG